MSQNSVVLRTAAPELSAFLTIFLNSEINRNQIIGLYSITKQKYINQGKIAALRVVGYRRKFDKKATDYLDGIKNYYRAVNQIDDAILKLNQELQILPAVETGTFACSPSMLDRKILTVPFYLANKHQTTDSIPEDATCVPLRELDRQKGDEPGSDNYLFEGVPFIKTSNFLNRGVDYQPNYYCSEAVHNEYEQDLKAGDILMAKDGKIGEVSILEESALVLISSGIVRIRPVDDKHRYWTFLVLSSDYGKRYFRKWSVIASTMAHLRKDFFNDFRFPLVSTKEQLIKTTANAFRDKKNAYQQIERAKNSLIEDIYQTFS